VSEADDPGSEVDPPLDRPPPPATWRERFEHLADATGVTPGRLAAGAVTAAALGVAVLWAVRPPPAPAEIDLPFASSTTTAAPGPQEEGAGPALPGGASPATSTSLVATEVVVHVAGAVVEAGVHRLPVGARVVDAVLAAGGLSPEADDLRVNLAAPVSDGERLYVPRHGEDDPPVPIAGVAPAAPAPGAPPGDGPPAPGEVVDLNHATGPELETLPGVGPATATAILEHRARAGPFTSVEQLMDVRGIGPAKLEQLRPLVRV
jgi:competence protein ComEA